jgi:Polysaccharide lyase
VISVGTWLGLPAANAGTAGTLGIWRGDYETGDFSQWSEIQASRTNSAYSVSAVGDTSGSVVTAPVRQGEHAAEFVTYPNRSRSDTDRAEVYADVTATEGTEGQDRYYAWSTRFPAAGNTDGFWRRAGDFNVFTQWHNANNPCGSNIQLGIDARSRRGGNRIYTDLSSRNPRDCDQATRTKHVTLGRLRFDVWYDFVAHIKWSTNPSVGFYELWMNGKQVLRKTFGQTMADSRGVYWKQGFYRAAFPHTNTVFQDAAIRGPSLSAVTRAFNLSIAGRPQLDSADGLTISARSFARARVRIVVLGRGRSVFGSVVRRADGAGRLAVVLPLARPFPHRVRVELQALVSSKLPAATRRASMNVNL